MEKTAKKGTPWRRCAECNGRLTRRNASMKANLCIFCYVAKLHKENEALKAEAAAAKNAALRECRRELETLTDTHMFGGYAWGHANVCPVG